MINRNILILIVDSSTIILLLVVDIILDRNPFVVQRGFFPDDRSLMHPLKPESISWSTVLIVSATAPTVVIIVCDCVICLVSNPIKLPINQSIYRCLKSLYIHSIILLVTFFLTTVIKYRIGRLRPHFLTVCRLDETIAAANRTTAFIDDPRACTGQADLVAVARQSFPSGHSSISAAAAASTILYLHHRMSTGAIRLPLQAVSVSLIALVIYVATSRLSDCWHHPTDVISGVVLGCLVALSLYYSQTDLFKRSTEVGVVDEMSHHDSIRFN